MVVVVMVLDKMRCDISLTVHLTCMYTWQIPTTPSIHFVAWKPPLLPLTSSHQKSLALSPSNCRGYKCFAESNGERLATWSLKLGDAHWWLEWACHDELFHTKSNRLQSKHRTSSHIATRSTTPSLVFATCLVFANDKPGLYNHINQNISKQWLYIKNCKNKVTRW